MRVNFSRNIYLILLITLIFGIAIQISRSQFVLKFQQNQGLLELRKELFVRVDHKKNIYNNGNNYCVAYSASEEYSSKLKENAVKTLEYMKKKTTVVNLDSQLLTSNHCEVVIVAVEKLNRLGNEKEIADFVFNGGHIFFMTILDVDSNYQVLYRKFGVSSFDGQEDTVGINLLANVLIGEKNLQISDEFIVNASLVVALDDESELLAESSEGLPLLWKRQYGKGAFMSFNGTMFQEKVNRGFFAGALSLLEPNFIYPIFNAKVFYIDDFPAPIAKGTAPVIYDQYKRDLPSFYQDIWWPNMLTIAKKYNIKYTGAIIESYNDDVNPPYSYPVDADRHNLITYGREIIKSGGEIGIHGYNHQSLVLDKSISEAFGYNAWNNKQDMSASIEEVLAYGKESFPEYTITSYIPPSNVLSNEGREALKDAWPELTVISSVYREDATEKSYVQEYEIAQDGIIEMPRVTSGYIEMAFERWAEANTMTALGVYSGFVHPDDVLSTDRGKNRTWEQLYQGFDKNMSRVEQTYPWLRPMTATESALDMAIILTTDVKWVHTDNLIEGEIMNYHSEASYILRTDQKIGKLSKCTVKKIDTNTYLVVANGSNFKIELGDS